MTISPAQASDHSAQPRRSATSRQWEKPIDVKVDHVVRRFRDTYAIKDVSLEIPRGALVVFTGVSGSGKSSLAFGTLYAEAQRRYFESVSPYARRLIDQVGVPDVDSIEGLPPAVALQQQRAPQRNRQVHGLRKPIVDKVCLALLGLSLKTTLRYGIDRRDLDLPFLRECRRVVVGS